MANTRSAQKNVRKSSKRRLVNLARRTQLKTTIKKVRLALENNSGQTTAEIEILLKDAASKLARAKNKGAIHPNTAARKLSRLAKKAAQLSRAAQ